MVSIFLRVSLLFTFFALFAQPAFAVESLEIPNFSSCLNPGGELRVSYEQGIHGVPGDQTALSGSDKVYDLDSSRNLQCFCNTDGNGVSTSWWKTGPISEDQINYLKSQGWVFVPDGSLWGLDADIYFAKNDPYTCGNLGTGGGTDGTNSSNTSNSSTSTNNSVPPRRGRVLGLATTGNLDLALALTFVGLVGVYVSGRLSRHA